MKLFTLRFFSFQPRQIQVVEAAVVVAMATPDSLLTPMLQPSAAWAPKELELPEATHLERNINLHSSK